MPVGLLCGFCAGAICYHTWDFGTGVLAGLAVSAVLSFLVYAYLSDYMVKSVARDLRKEVKNNLVDWYEQQGLETGYEPAEDEADWWKDTDGQDSTRSGFDST